MQTLSEVESSVNGQQQNGRAFHRGAMSDAESSVRAAEAEPSIEDANSRVF